MFTMESWQRGAFLRYDEVKTPGKVNCHCLSPGMAAASGNAVPESKSFGAQGRSVTPCHSQGLPFDRSSAEPTTGSPFEVFTDLLLNDSTPELRKFPFGVLAAQPEEAAPAVSRRFHGVGPVKDGAMKDADDCWMLLAVLWFTCGSTNSEES